MKNFSLPVALAAILAIAPAYAEDNNNGAPEYDHVQWIIDQYPKPDSVSNERDSASLALIFDRNAREVSANLQVEQVSNLRECFSLAYDALLDPGAIGWHGTRIAVCVRNGENGQSEIAKTYSCKGFNHGVLCETPDIMKPN